MISQAQVAAELRGEIPIDASEKRQARFAFFGHEWVDIREARRILCCSSGALYQRTLLWDSAIEARPASLSGGSSARKVGLIFRREDCERVAAIRRRCRLSLTAACRVYAVIKSGDPL